MAALQAVIANSFSGYTESVGVSADDHELVSDAARLLKSPIASMMSRRSIFGNGENAAVNTTPAQAVEPASDVTRSVCIVKRSRGHLWVPATDIARAVLLVCVDTPQ